MGIGLLVLMPVLLAWQEWRGAGSQAALEALWSLCATP
jgi:hypothetical protein